MHKNQSDEELSLMHLVGIQDIKIMKEQPWWTACSMTPFLVKGAIISNCYILIITNIRQTWACKGDQQQILNEKQRFNSSIETNTFAGVCEMLEQVITKFSPKSTYLFEIDDHKQTLNFNFHSVIKIYPLKWTFKLSLIKESEHFDLLCEDLINPLICTVRSLEHQCEYYKDALLQTERELGKRMNEREKTFFKSKTADTEDEWRLSLIEDQMGHFRIGSLELGAKANYFMRYYCLYKLLQMEREHKKRNVNLKEPVLVQRQNQPNNKGNQKKTAILEAYEQSLVDLFQVKPAQQIEQAEEEEEQQQKQKQTRKKDKKLGFL